MVKKSSNLQGIKKNVSLAKYTTYRIGGKARYFFMAKTKQDLIKAIEFAKEKKLPVFVLGGGSNVLFDDKGFEGLVIKFQVSSFKFQDSKIYAGAGIKLKKIVQFAQKKLLTGLEWANGIPGTFGGAIYGNAQAFLRRMSDFVESVEVLDKKTLKIKNILAKNCKFKTKNSVFKRDKNLIIVSAVLRLGKGNKKEIKEKMKEFLEYRKIRHPKLLSAGSVFINKEIKIKNKKLLKKFPELIEFNEKDTIPSAYLIEKSGLKGNKIGRAQISEKHANFIVNLGGAKAKDVLALIKLAKKRVKANFGIELEEEIQIVTRNL